MAAWRGIDIKAAIGHSWIELTFRRCCRTLTTGSMVSSMLSARELLDHFALLWAHHRYVSYCSGEAILEILQICESDRWKRDITGLS